jgi:hypothetical protein
MGLWAGDIAFLFKKTPQSRDFAEFFVVSLICLWVRA